MKILIPIAIALAVCSNAVAQQSPAAAAAISANAAAIGMLPHEKRGTELEETERNPFAERVSTDEVVGEADGDSEESRIRAVLTALRVSGTTRGGGGSIIAEFGGMALEEGRMLPPIIQNQTDRLKVTKIEANEIEITWVDAEGTHEPRKHVIFYDLEPKITTLLPLPDPEGNGQLTERDPRADLPRAVGPVGDSSPALTSRGDTPSPVD